MINMVIFYTLRSLILTIIIEVIMSLLLKIGNKEDIILIVLVNIFTNLLVTSLTFSFNYFYGLEYVYYVELLLELFAFISEAIIYKKYLNFKKINPYLISLVLNMSSYLIGLLINYIF